MIALIGFILVICGLGAWVVFEMYQHLKKKEQATQFEIPPEVTMANRIIEEIYRDAYKQKGKIAGNKVSKVFLMERVNLKPRQLSIYLDRLVNKNIIEEQQDTVSMTPFGVEFYKFFGGSDGKVDFS